MPSAPCEVPATWQEQAARAGLLDKLLCVPMPECCGYDLADLELVPRDGERLVDSVGTGRPVLVLGIRTGGAYLAPLWRAALAERGVARLHWCTVRPAADGDGIHGIGAALA
jgi:neamine phosphoribosyltransferase